MIIMNKKDLCVCVDVVRWTLFLEEFSYTIEHRLNKNIAHINALSHYRDIY